MAGEMRYGRVVFSTEGRRRRTRYLRIIFMTGIFFSFTYALRI